VKSCVRRANLRCYLWIMLVHVGPCIPISFCSLKMRGESESWWLQFIWEKKNGGELGHDNVLAALND